MWYKEGIRNALDSLSDPMHCVKKTKGVGSRMTHHVSVGSQNAPPLKPGKHSGLYILSGLMAISC